MRFLRVLGVMIVFLQLVVLVLCYCWLVVGVLIFLCLVVLVFFEVAEAMLAQKVFERPLYT